MPNWITLEAADFNDARVAKLVTALRTAALGAGQDDPLPEFIADAAKQLRASIRFGGRPVEEVELAVPRSLKEVAVEKVIRRAKKRLQMNWTEQEGKDEETYLSLLNKLNRGEWPVEAPDTPVAQPDVQPTAGAVAVVHSRPRIATGGALSRL